MRRPAASLADRLRALVLLVPGTPATVGAMLQDMLPLGEWQGNVTISEPRAAAAGSQPRPVELDEPADPAQGKTTAGLDAQSGVQPAQVAATRVTRLPRRPLLTVAGTAALDLGGTVPVREPLPLIHPIRMRAMLAALAAAPGTEGAIDIEALIERVGRGMPMAGLPKRSNPTLRRGAQLLVDCSPALMPLAHDVDMVEQRLQAVVGAARLQRLYFAGCPARGAGPGDRSSWRRWQPPAAGVPVVLITDLGCAGPRGNAEWASPMEWSRFADRARAADVTLVALVPYPASRVPATLARRVAIVPWTEGLGVAELRRIVRDGRKISRAGMSK